MICLRGETVEHRYMLCHVTVAQASQTKPRTNHDEHRKSNQRTENKFIWDNNNKFVMMPRVCFFSGLNLLIFHCNVLHDAESRFWIVCQIHFGSVKWWQRIINYLQMQFFILNYLQTVLGMANTHLEREWSDCISVPMIVFITMELSIRPFLSPWNMDDLKLNSETLKQCTRRREF